MKLRVHYVIHCMCWHVRGLVCCLCVALACMESVVRVAVVVCNHKHMFDMAVCGNVVYLLVSPAWRALCVVMM